MKQQSYKKKPSPNKIIASDWSDIVNSSVNKLRTSNLKFDGRSSDLFMLRSSFSNVSLRNHNEQAQNDFRYSNLHTIKKNQLQSLKSTLDQLEDKVNSAKQQLQMPSTAMKKKQQPTVHYQENLILTEEQAINPSDSSITLKNSDKKLAALISSAPKPKNFKPIYTNPYSPRRHCVYYVSEAVRAVNERNSLILEHINASIRIIKDCEPYEIPALADMEQKRLNLKKREQDKKKKTLVLDLDQTLIHCVDNYETDADLKLSIKLTNDDSRLHCFGVNIRPYALTFLKKMSKNFEIIIFTASQQEYADAILDELDPDNELFQHRLYRQHCWVLQNQMHVKDLRIINRSLSQIVLIDNAAYSYAFQLENGIPILPYYEGSDYELAALEAYLDQVERSADVRQLNKRTFKLHHYTKFCNGQQLIQQLYMNSTH